MPYGVRSRGCEACQRRKIKCDGKTPACGKCEKLGISCKGPSVGPIILPFDPQKLQSRRSRNASNNLPKIADTDVSSESRPLTPYAAYSIRTTPDSAVMKDWFTLKLQECVYIPHQRHQSLVPDLAKLSASGSHPVLQRAVWATSAAFSGVASQTPDLLEKARELYAGILKSLMRELSETDTTEGTAELNTAQRRPVSVEAVAVAALFVWYEAIVGTNPYGWIAHTFGAVRILLRRPPEDYRLGFSHKIFRTVRYMMANCTITTVQPSVLGTPLWLTVPFSLTVKLGFDRLLDFMFIIPKYLSWVNERCASELPIPLTIEATKVLGEVRLLERGLINFFLSYEKEKSQGAKERWFLEVAPDRIHSTGEYQPKTRQYYSEEIVELVSHYEICRLLIALIKASFSDATGFIACRAEAVEHSASILSGVAFAEATSTTRMFHEHFAYACILITTLVASPEEAHRNYARLKIESWGGGNGLVGVSPNHSLTRWHVLRLIWDRMALPLEQMGVSKDVEEVSHARPFEELKMSVRTV